jgi:hypothetical protein
VAIGDGGVKSLEKARQMGLNAGELLRHRGRRKVRQPSLLDQSIRRRRKRDQALALLSTARSERSA